MIGRVTYSKKYIQLGNVIDPLSTTGVFVLSLVLPETKLLPIIPSRFSSLGFSELGPMGRYFLEAYFSYKKG